jgi:hypothetical protein
VQLVALKTFYKVSISRHFVHHIICFPPSFGFEYSNNSCSSHQQSIALGDLMFRLSVACSFNGPQVIAQSESSNEVVNNTHIHLLRVTYRQDFAGDDSLCQFMVDKASNMKSAAPRVAANSTIMSSSLGVGGRSSISDATRPSRPPPLPPSLGETFNEQMREMNYMVTAANAAAADASRYAS